MSNDGRDGFGRGCLVAIVACVVVDAVALWSIARVIGICSWLVTLAIAA